MRTFIFLAIIGVCVAAAPAAFAATDTGTIKKVDPKGDAITLDDGKVFVLAEGTEAESLKVGDKVVVTFKLKAGRMIATKVQVASNLHSLFQYLIDNRHIEEIRDYQEKFLRIYPPTVLAKLKSGDESWEKMVPPEVAQIIKEREFFGFRRAVAA